MHTITEKTVPYFCRSCMMTSSVVIREDSPREDVIQAIEVDHEANKGSGPCTGEWGEYGIGIGTAADGWTGITAR